MFASKLARPLVLLILISSGSAAHPNFYPPLEQSVDPELQRELRGRLEALDLTDALAERRLAVSLVDITDPYRPRVAEFNGDVMLYAASLPKIAILLGAFQRMADRGEAIDPAMEEKLIRMIRYSSNQDATDVLESVGEEYLAEVLRSERYQFYKPEKGGLWVGKAYGKAPAFQRDPLFNISHGASSHEVARFFYLLDTGRLVSPESCDRMKEIMSEPAIHHKFVSGMEQVDPDARLRPGTPLPFTSTVLQAPLGPTHRRTL